MTAKITTDQHRARGTYQPCRHYDPEANNLPTSQDHPAAAPLRHYPAAPLADLGDAGRRLWHWAWDVWGAVLTESDEATITNLAQLADQAADMDAAYEAAPESKRAMAGRLRVSARLRFTNELARVSALADKAMRRA